MARDIVVNIAACGEANAFYDLDDQSVTMCTEMTGWLDTIGQELGLK
ncbi:DUF4344 domain-containing metallopeptidase [Planktotalea sp.]|nr:DUF4344 domain-containing metallopeptidase [Planktotalea sp.]